MECEYYNYFKDFIENEELPEGKTTILNAQGSIDQVITLRNGTSQRLVLKILKI